VLVSPVQQRGAVDVHDDLSATAVTGPRVAARTGRDEFDEGVDGEAFERDVGVAVALSDAVEVPVEDGVDAGGGFGIEFGEQFVHAGGLVDPAGDLRAGLLLVELAGAVVGSGDQAHQITHIAFELGDPVAFGRVQQVVGEPVDR
jgi:hypothetical protein